MIPGIAFLAGLLLVSFGVWRIYAPAGFIVFGLAVALVAVAYERGGKA